MKLSKQQKRDIEKALHEDIKNVAFYGYHVAWGHELNAIVSYAIRHTIAACEEA